MPKTPECYGKFMSNVNNPNCYSCWCRQGCYKRWNDDDKKKQKLLEEATRLWYEKAPLSKMFIKEELCLGKCEREVEE